MQAPVWSWYMQCYYYHFTFLHPFPETSPPLSVFPSLDFPFTTNQIAYVLYMYTYMYIIHKLKLINNCSFTYFSKQSQIIYTFLLLFFFNMYMAFNILVVTVAWFILTISRWMDFHWFSKSPPQNVLITIMLCIPWHICVFIFME